MSSSESIRTGPQRPLKVYDCTRNKHPWEYVGYARESQMFEGTVVIKGSEVYRCPMCGAVETD